MMFDGSKNDLVSRWYAASLALAALKIVYIDVADFIHFYCFFISNETILSSAKFAAQTMTLLQKMKNKKKW